MRQVGSKPVSGLLSLVAGQLAAPPVMILARWVENALDVSVQGSHDANPKSFVACSIEQRRAEDGDWKGPWSWRTAKQNPAEAGCAYLEMTLMNFDYGGAVNFFAIIIGH